MFSPNTPSKFLKILWKPLKVGDRDSFGNYLGCSMEIDGRTLTQFQNLVDKISKKLLSWKYLTLSQAGKIVLINSILTALSAHILAIYLMPEKILGKMACLKIFCTSSMDKKPIYWKKKEALYKDKIVGGLGLRNIVAFNKAMVFKQAWRIHNCKSLLISRVSSHMKDGLWFRIGNGKSVNSKGSRWAGSEPMNLVWRLFEPEDAKKIGCTCVSMEEEDEVIWNSTTNGEYSVKAGYMWLNRSFEDGVDNKFWKMFWRIKVPPKWLLLAWKIMNRSTSCRSKVRKRRLQVQHECPLFAEKIIAIIWGIWIHRNDIIFREAKPNPSGLMSNIEHAGLICGATSSQLGRAVEEKHAEKPPTAVLVQGIARRRKIVVVTVDGSWKSASEGLDAGAVGWVITRHDTMVGEGSEVVAGGSALQCELLAIRKRDRRGYSGVQTYRDKSGRQEQRPIHSRYNKSTKGVQEHYQENYILG
uniref:Reverse transcriptase zinc-binding domain-containing protein n=1 Tax=Chenopodium quinoa TaxID=63459 RepID=A0A803MN65_CHEQI